PWGTVITPVNDAVPTNEKTSPVPPELTWSTWPATVPESAETLAVALPGTAMMDRGPTFWNFANVMPALEMPTVRLWPAPPSIRVRTPASGAMMREAGRPKDVLTTTKLPDEVGKVETAPTVVCFDVPVAFP